MKSFLSQVTPIITPEHVFAHRRQLLKQLAALCLLPMGPSNASIMDRFTDLGEPETDFKLVSSYNNYLEFTDNKEMVKHIAKNFVTSSWSLTINGLVDKPLVLSLEDLNTIQTETRIYRLRCVEGWSAVIPWQGFELRSLLAKLEIETKAKFISFTGCLNPTQMVGQRNNNLNWPYHEGLRLDEALHPLTFIATGMYGKPLTKQNGAPLRLVVPWKYGYKSIKAITEITLTEQKPISSWQENSPAEYGFYANVNPNISHPRWSQRREVRLGELQKRKTDLLNGYAEYLTGLYTSQELNSLR